MSFLQNHIWRCFVAGIVALLPILGIVVSVVYFESVVAGSWLNRQGFYFFGMGLLIAIAVTYLVGLFFSNVMGRWIWNMADRILDRLPILGNLYQTLKQILGYGEGENAMFQRVVYVRCRDFDAEEIGLVTGDPRPDEADQRLKVFLPFSPSPVNGRLVFIDRTKTRPASMSVNEALKTLVSIGTMSEPLSSASADTVEINLAELEGRTVTRRNPTVGGDAPSIDPESDGSSKPSEQ